MGTDRGDRPDDEPTGEPDDVVSISREALDELFSRGALDEVPDLGRMQGLLATLDSSGERLHVSVHTHAKPKLQVSTHGSRIVVHTHDASLRERLRSMDAKEWAAVLGGLGGAASGFAAWAPPQQPQIEYVQEAPDHADRIDLLSEFPRASEDEEVLLDAMERLGLEDRFVEIGNAEWDAGVPFSDKLGENLRDYLRSANEEGLPQAEVDGKVVEMVQERARLLGLV